MGTGERALANLGAGFDAAWQGLKQVVPGMKGASDAEILEKRERDQALADATDTGVGADWMPSGGKLLQFAGETAPTLAIPGVGVGGRLAQTALTRALPRATQAAQAFARAAGTGATGGAAAGALQPTTSDESRLGNIVLGAAGGTVLPAAGAAWRAGRQLVSNMTRGGGTRARASSAARGAGRRRRQRGAGRGSARPGEEISAPIGARHSRELAEASGSPTAARVESSARRSGDTAGAWDDFVGEQNVARYNAFVDATREAPRLDARVAARDRYTDPVRTRALGDAAQDPWFHVPAVQAAERVAASPTSVNPAVAACGRLRAQPDRRRRQDGDHARAAVRSAQGAHRQVAWPARHRR